MNVRRSLASLLVLSALAAPAAAQPTPTAPAGLPAGTEPYGPEVLVAKEDAVPVRTEPGFVYREIRFLRKGQEVVVDGRKAEWMHVRPQGWILRDHLVSRDELDKPASAEPASMVPVREGIRVRASPSTDAAVTRTLSEGEAVTVTGQEAGWWKLEGGGYVASALLRPDSDDEPAATEPGRTEPWVVSAESANVRADRTTTAPVLRKLARGAVVPVASVQDGWAEVPGGWVRADLLQAPAPRPPTPGGRDFVPVPRVPRDASVPRRWSLVDLNGVIFEITDISRSPLLPQIKKELKETGLLEEDWTYLGLTIGVPDESAYRFNFSPERNNVIVIDVDGQRFGNVWTRGPIERLPPHVRQFFAETTVGQGEKYDALLLFKPSLKAADIAEISMFIGGRMQRFYEDTTAR